MTLVEKLRLLQDRKHFEKLVNEKHEKIINEKKTKISLFIIYVIFNFILIFFLPYTIFNFILFMFSLISLAKANLIFIKLNFEYPNREKIKLIIEEKRYGYRVLKCFFNDVVYVALPMTSVVLVLLIFGIDNYKTVYSFYSFHCCFLIISLCLFLLEIFVLKFIYQVIDEEVNDLIRETKVDICDEYFNDVNLKLKYSRNDEIQFINQVSEKLSDELNNDDLLKELTLIDKFKESKLKIDLNEVAELNSIALSVLSVNKSN